MKKTLLAGLATVLFLLTSTGIAMAGDDAKNNADGNNSKTTGLYDNVTILQEQINSLTERIGRIETLHKIGDRFIDKGDGTVLDNDTGLIWLKDASCSELHGTSSGGMANWSGAKSAAAALADGTCGLADGSTAGDWRLPDNAEWGWLFSNYYEAPALANTVGDAQWSEGDAFTGVQSAYYWTINEILDQTDSAWTANMYGGYLSSDFKTFTNYVWPVRSGN
jgi:hypothetical protein